MNQEMCAGAGAALTGGREPAGDCGRARVRGEIPVHVWQGAPAGGPILYASIPAALPRSKSETTPSCQAEQSLLVQQLCAHFFRGQALPPPEDLNLVTGPLGQPRLLVRGVSGPSLSFSWGGNRLWAALGDQRWGLGIDVAGAGEFSGEYPYPRVFHPAEFWQVSRITGGEAAEAAALLWAVKEAAVKALGCGFYFFGPRALRVEPAGAGEDGQRFGAFLATSPGDPHALRLPVMVRREGDVWLAAALALKEALAQTAWARPPGGRQP
jgi:phosphopantetheinyl transferase